MCITVMPLRIRFEYPITVREPFKYTVLVPLMEHPNSEAGQESQPRYPGKPAIVSYSDLLLRLPELVIARAASGGDFADAGPPDAQPPPQHWEKAFAPTADQE